MRYRERPPIAPLRDVVECFWFLESDSEVRGEERLERILPDGCPELILTRGDRGALLTTGGSLVPQPRVQVAGQLTRFLTVDLGQHVDVVGVRFLPAGAALFFGAGIAEWTDRVLDAHDVAPRLGRELEPLLEERDTETLADTVEELLVARRARARRDRAGDAVVRAVEHLLRTRGRVRIDALSAEVGLSTRQLLRLFKPRVGISPKELARVLRFQSVFQAVDAGPPATGRPSWTDVALSAGYYDQAHLNRDFGELAGASPPRLFELAGPVTHSFTRSGR